jgi:glycosyltransferase involved in cell wall biosynthesis
LYGFGRRTERRHAPTVSLIGQMGWYPSYSAAVRLLTRLWPRIKQRVPAARLEIAGWSARRALREYCGLEDVEIFEDIPSVEEFFGRSSVFVYAPLRGSGMKVKVLEAMAFGVPVVTTDEGVEGIPAEDRVHARICNDDEGLIERTVEILKDQRLAEAQRGAARELVTTHCSPIRVVDQIERIYERMTGARGGRRGHS